VLDTLCRLQETNSFELEGLTVSPTQCLGPEADFIADNPPFIGAANMCRALGDDSADAVCEIYSGLENLGLPQREGEDKDV
jgi:hypothetical protein